MKALIIKTVCVFALVALVAGNSWSQTAEQLFQKGIMKEEGEGSLREAIELYKSVADNTNADKVLRAKALYQMGSCYEKLGQQDARNVYEKLVANYTDPQELVANAKRKLVKLYSAQIPSENSVVSERQINDASYFDMTYSPDGSYVVINDPEKDNLCFTLRNLKTGEKWNFTKTGTWEMPVYRYPNSAIWSKDSKHVAYTWKIEDRNKKELTTELHIFDLDSKNDKIVWNGPEDIWLTDWSIDNKNIVCVTANSIALISLSEGIEKSVIDLGERQIINPHFTNDNNFIIFSAQSQLNADNYDIYSISKNGGNVNPLVTFNEKDGPSFSVPNSDQVVFISEHSGTKDIWEVTVKNGSLTSEPMVLKNSLDVTAKLMGVLNDGTIIYSFQRLDPEFFYAKLDFEKNDVTFYPLLIKRNPSRQIMKTIWSPTMSKVAVLIADGFTSQVKAKIKIVTQDLKTQAENEISTDFYTFPSMPWVNPIWTPDEKSLLIQASKEGKDMGIYKFDVESGEVSDYAAPLTNVAQKWVDLQFSPDGETQYFLWQKAYQTFPQNLITRSVKTGEEKILAQFDKTIYNFCLSPNGKYITFRDDKSIWLLPTDGSEKKRIIENLDETWFNPLGWSNDNRMIYVIKLQDKSNFKLGWGIWSVPTDGSMPKEIISAEKLAKFQHANHIRMHNVGNDIFLSMQNGDRIYEAWKVENIVQK